jgi:hypothetical protein
MTPLPPKCEHELFVEQHENDSVLPALMLGDVEQQEDSRASMFTGKKSLKNDDDGVRWASNVENEHEEQQRLGYGDCENEFTEAEEREVLKKMDKRVVMFVALLYLLSFLDRSNIGNARIAGLERDLKLSSNQYEWLLTGFYITYILFEWMALL